MRQGKVQRMTTKNGLPCNSVISFIKDKEKRWWLHMVVASSSSQIPNSNDGGRIPKRSFRPVFTTYSTERGRQAAVFQFSGILFGWARVVCDADLWCRWWTLPGSRKERSRRQTYIESLVADRKEFTATLTSRSRRIQGTCRLITPRPPLRFRRK